MLSKEHTQSLSDFRHNAGATLDRLNQTGEAEILTVDGQARAVLLSLAAYDAMARELVLARDVAVIRQSMKQIDEGKGISVEQLHAQLQSKLLALKTARGISE